MQLNNQNRHALKPVTITGNEEISPNVFVVSWKREEDFNPGQVVKIAIDPNEPPRIYSICSGNQEENVSVLFNVKPGGVLTPQLAKKRTGDLIYVSAPYGSFSSDDAPATWIATGTGIAPFYSMIRSGRFKNKKLIHGVSYINQFYFEDYLHKELGDRYICCCSRETGTLHFPGRITDYLKQVQELPKGDKYYLCGQALMVVEVRDLLIGRGIPYDHIYAEIYF